MKAKFLRIAARVFQVTNGQNGRNGQDAVNPFKGWWPSPQALLNSGIVAKEGDYAYVIPTVSTDPVDIWEYDANDDGTDNYWHDSGRDFNPAYEQSFATGEHVNEVSIDSSHLNNPASNSLVKAIDVKDFKQQLSGSTFEESKVELTEQNVTTGYKILGSTGLPSQVNAYDYLEVSVEGFKRVRFLGAILRSNLSSSDKNSGYAFGHYENNSWVTDKAVNYDINTTEDNSVREYVDSVPSASTHFRCACKFGNIMTHSMFYCYMVKGETIIETVNKNNFLKGSNEYSVTGIGSSPVYVVLKLQEGHAYRVYKPVGAEYANQSTSMCFGWARIVGGSIPEYGGVYYSYRDLTPDYFDIIAKESDYYRLFFRTVVGNECTVKVEEIDISSNDIVLTLDAKVQGKVLTSNGNTDLVGTSTTDCIFKFKRPTLGKKFLKLTWPIILNGSVSGRGLAWYNRNGDFISGISYEDVNVSGTNNSSSGGQRESVPILIAIPDGVYYFNYTYWAENSLTNYPWLRKIGDVVLTDNGENTIPLIGGNFSSFVDFLDYDGPVGDNLMLNQDYTALINLWEEVRTANSDRISRTLLGYATAAGSGTATPDMTLPIYEYVVKPIPHNDTGYEEYDTVLPNNLAKVLIVTGVHGSEKPASQAVLELVKHLTGYYTSTKFNDVIISMAQNCEFHIVPCVNPYGYNITDASQGAPRKNARGVNINRNFGWNWANQYGGNVSDKGTEAYSELETQIVRDFIAANKDAFVFVDNHTTSVSNSNGQGCFSYPFDLNSKSLLNSYLKQVSIYASRQWPSIFNGKQYIGFIGFNNLAGTVSEARYIANIPRVATLEINNYFGGNTDRGAMQNIILSLNQLINYIRLCLLTANKTTVKV